MQISCQHQHLTINEYSVMHVFILCAHAEWSWSKNIHILEYTDII